jgi:SAM-dependent methyltransferase
MQICNPLTSAELDEVLDSTELVDDAAVLDVGCGYGEVLFRAAERARIQGTGVDLSPWMIAAAASHQQSRAPTARLRWVLGEASDFVSDIQPDVSVCIGAEWVWHDFRGTARALAEHLGPEGVAVLGAARLHTAADSDLVRRERGVVETLDDQRDVLRDFGFEPIHRVDADDAGWDSYLSRTADAARSWADLYPGPASDQWVHDQADWSAARENDREVIGWSVWIARLDRASRA